MSEDIPERASGRASLFGNASLEAVGNEKYGEFGSSVVGPAVALPPELFGESVPGDTSWQDKKPAARFLSRSSPASLKSPPEGTPIRPLTFGSPLVAAAASTRGNSKSDRVTGVVHCSGRELTAHPRCWGPIGREQDKFCTLEKRRCQTASHINGSFNQIKPDRFYIKTTGKDQNRAYCLPVLKASHLPLAEETSNVLGLQMKISQ